MAAREAVWVWLNDKQTVDGAVLDNFKRADPIVAKGPLEFQPHGSEIRFRNLYLTEPRP
jgi:hypothetical protein